MPFHVDVRVPVPIRVSVDVARLPRPASVAQQPDVAGVLVLAMAAGVLATALAVGLVAAVAGSSEGAERAAFFLVVLGCAAAVHAVVLAARDLDHQAARTGAAMLVGIGAGLVLGRVSGASPGFVTVLVVLGAAAGPAVLARMPPTVPAVAAAAVATAAALAFWPPDAPVTPVSALAGAVAGGATAWLLERRVPGRVARRVGAGRRRVRLLFDGLFLLAFLLVITDTLFVPDESISEHMGFYLGPVNEIMHGRAMLVDTWSQYGNGVMYALAPWFLVAPIGFGTFSILTTVATGLQYVVVYAILRQTLRSQVLAIGAVGLAAVVILFAQLGDYANYPSVGVLRFGPPYLVVLLGILAARVPRRRALLAGLAAVVVAVAVPWSAETAATTVAVAAALLAVHAAAARGPAASRLRRLVRSLAGLAGVCLGALAVFAVATRIAAGAWPDPGPYLEFLRLYTTAGFGTLPVPEWSPGLVVGAVYAASAVMTAALVVLRPDAVRRRLDVTCAYAGLTALGFVSYTYFLGRSHPNNVMHVCLPAFMLLALWLDGRGLSVVSGRERAFRWSAALLMAVAVVAFVESVPAIRAKWSRTAFAAVVPGGGAGPTQQSLILRARDMWSNPAVDPLAPAAADFVRRHVGGRPPVLVLRSSLFAETLLRLRAVDALPIAIPSQDSLSPASFPRVRAAVAGLPEGSRLFLRTDEGTQPVDEELVELQRSELRWVRERFDLHLLERDPATGLTAFELARRT